MVVYQSRLVYTGEEGLFPHWEDELTINKVLLKVIISLLILCGVLIYADLRAATPMCGGVKLAVRFESS